MCSSPDAAVPLHPETAVKHLFGLPSKSNSGFTAAENRDHQLCFVMFCRRQKTNIVTLSSYGPSNGPLLQLQVFFITRIKIQIHFCLFSATNIISNLKQKPALHLKQSLHYSPVSNDGTTNHIST